jgi:hypothetical protein
MADDGATRWEERTGVSETQEAPLLWEFEVLVGGGSAG